MAHISRKELKKDEIRDTFAHGAEAVLSHQQLTMYLVIAALVVALGFFGWKTYTERQTTRASAAFDDAMADFQARVITPGEPTYRATHLHRRQNQVWRRIEKVRCRCVTISAHAARTTCQVLRRPQSRTAG